MVYRGYSDSAHLAGLRGPYIVLGMELRSVMSFFLSFLSELPVNLDVALISIHNTSFSI